jgi:hypothetical protein
METSAGFEGQTESKKKEEISPRERTTWGLGEGVCRRRRVDVREDGDWARKDHNLRH